MKPGQWAIVSLLAVAMVWGAADPTLEKAGQVWWAHVEYLASDELQGRNVGSPGYEKAAEYVAEQFAEAALKPAGENAYFQRVRFIETAIRTADSKLALDCGGSTRSVAVPGEAQLGYSQSSAEHMKAGVVFAGYGLVIPEAHHDDLANVAIKGKIVAYFTGGPASIDGNLRSHYSSGEERWKALKARGAVGIIAIPDPKSMEIPWARQIQSWGMPRMALADAALQTNSGLRFGAMWDPAKADDLLAGSGHTFAEVLEAAHAERPLPHFPLACSVDATVRTTHRDVDSKNIAGVYPGSEARDQFLVISAHLDHLGVGKPVKGDAIYNGAMDDASGVASLIEVAKALSRQRLRTRRSILFLAVTGEEKGELGSTYFASHPTVRGRIVADLNMDMYLPLFPLRWLEVQGLNESSLGDDVRAVAEANGVRVQADKEPNRNRFIRSDQYSFIKKGVPALAFKFGYQPGDPEEKIFKDWYSNRYHGVSDDVNQPVDKAAAAKFNRILEQLAIRVADADQLPLWKQSSFFRRFATATQ